MTGGAMADWGRMSRAARDAAYNNSAAVADSPALNQARAALSAHYRSSWEGHLNLAYGPTQRQQWDLFPAADPAAPCFVFIHGGYWQRNQREDFVCLGAGLRQHGWAVALPGYELTPAVTLTELVAQLRRALDWLGENRAAHGMTGPVLLSGWSAGGHLTVMLLDHPVVTAGLAISGLYELGPIRDTYLNEALRLTDEEIEALSPLRRPMVRKPMAITYGTAELSPLVADSRDLHAVRSAQHLAGSLVPAPGCNHFTIVEQLQTATGLLVRAALEVMS